jgi:hypothetical protein
VQAAWIPRLTIWRDDDTTERREGELHESWAEAMAASWRLASRAPNPEIEPEVPIVSDTL